MTATIPTSEVCFACILWGDKYPPLYVQKLHAAIRKHSSLPCDFFCLTDRPSEVHRTAPEISTIESPNDYRGWWQKINLFDHKTLHRRHVIYFDLDIVLMKSIDPLLSYLGQADMIHARDLIDPISSSILMIDTQSQLAQDVVSQFDSRIIGDPDPGDQWYLQKFVGTGKYSTACLPAHHHYSYKFLIDHQDWRSRAVQKDYASIDLTEVVTLNFHGAPNPFDLSLNPSRWKYADAILPHW